MTVLIDTTYIGDQFMAKLRRRSNGTAITSW